MVSKRIIDSGLSLDWISLQTGAHWVRNTDCGLLLQRIGFGLLDFHVTWIKVPGSKSTWIRSSGFGFKEYLDSVSRARFSFSMNFLDSLLTQVQSLSRFIGSTDC